MWKWLCVLILVSSTSLRGDCCISPSIYFGAEGLWWIVCQEDLEFAVDVTSDGDELVGPGETHALEYDWRGGVRGFIGFDGYCGWDIRGVYTWYKNDTDEIITEEGDSFLIATWAHPGGIGFNALTATASQHFKYQTADLIFGKEISFCPFAFTFEPFIGIRGLKLNQNVSALYEGEDFADNPQQITFESDLKALGLYGGLHMRNNLCCGLGFYGDFAGSLLYGKGKSTQQQLSLNSLGAIVDTVVDLEDNRCRVLPGCHLRAGIDWLFEVRSLFFHIQAGYEFNHWFNTPIVTRFYDNVNHGVSSSSSKGEISIHGATLSAALRF